MQAHEPENRGPLAGLKIIDLSTVIAGPLASTLLADLGAEVLTRELPDGRDTMRALPPLKDGVPLLTLGTPVNGSIAPGQDLYYRVLVTPGREVTVAADFVALPGASVGSVTSKSSPPKAMFHHSPRPCR